MEIRRKNIHGPLSEDELLEFERLIGQRLPSDYRDFLIENNCCDVFPKDFKEYCTEKYYGMIKGDLFGLHDYEYSKINYIDDYYSYEEKFIVIGEDLGNDSICISTTLGVVVLDPDTDSGIVTLAKNFSEFLSVLYRFKRWNDTIEDKMYCDLEDDLPLELEKHLNKWMDSNYIFPKTNWNLLEAAVVNTSLETIKLLHKHNAPLGNAYIRAKTNYLDESLKDNYKVKEVYELIKNLYKIPD
jgi:hypothetical protein